ncbi:hypothetical protein CDL15_Pgr004204 [Punica granatum]|nr:hypothetical protein CDL15_Pgr004204 [Punica granatum]
MKERKETERKDDTTPTTTTTTHHLHHHQQSNIQTHQNLFFLPPFRRYQHSEERGGGRGRRGRLEPVARRSHQWTHSHRNDHVGSVLMIMISPAHPPFPPSPFWASSPTPSPSPSQSPFAAPATVAASSIPRPPSPPPSSRAPVSFSPPLIAMVAVVATAFLIVFYFRPISRHLLRLSRWRRRRRVHRSASSVDLGSPPTTGFFDSPLHDPSFHYSPYGLDDAVIKTIPLSLYASKANKHGTAVRECAVCLLEFEEDDYVRTLPACSHAFHVDCIDMWLRSHANCPLCRAGIFRPDSPFTPLMAARIRPSLDEDPILRDIIIEETLADLESDETAAPASAVGEITEEPSPRRVNPGSDDRFRDFMLKRSYSFGFERSIASERMLVMEPATTSPCRYRRSGGGGFWSKRPSPFGSLSKPRVFSFRYYRGMKSPFFRRRGFFPLSESSVRFSTFGSGGGGGSSRRSKSLMSPMFGGRSGVAVSSSRLRCGDPEALLSPERFNRR